MLLPKKGHSISKYGLLVCCWTLPVLVSAQRGEGLPQNTATSATTAAPINLLDNTLSHWYKWVGVPHYSVPGLPTGTPTGDGMHGMPLGRNDPKKVFNVVTINGKRVLHISGEIYGALTTNREYGDYHLRLQYKWGAKKWPPRATRPRDSGLILHATGRPEDAYWSVFMLGLECQISERTTGDLLFMTNKDSTLVPIADVRSGTDNQWVETEPYQRVGGRGKNPKFYRSANYESAATRWTTVDVYVVGRTGVYLVNDHPVMAFQNAGIQQSDSTIVPLKKGRIQIQSEGAEVYYRNVSIRPITAIPSTIRKAAALDKTAP